MSPAPKCPACLLSIEGTPQECARCNTPYHAECARAGCLVAGCAATAATGRTLPPPLPGAQPQPGRGTFARAGAGARALVSVLPAVWPFLCTPLVVTAVANWLQFRSPSYAPIWRNWWLLQAGELLAGAIAYPALTLLLLEPDLRRARAGAVLARAVRTWPRWFPAALPLGIALPYLTQAASSIVYFGPLSSPGATVLMILKFLIHLAIVSALCMGPVLACEEPAREPGWPLVRGVRFALRLVPIPPILLLTTAVDHSIMRIIGPSLWAPSARVDVLHAWGVPLLFHALAIMLMYAWPIACLLEVYRDFSPASRA